MENDAKPMSTKELTQAVSLLLEREESRIAQQRRKQRRRVRRRREETRASISQLTQSIETIKVCRYQGSPLLVDPPDLTGPLLDPYIRHRGKRDRNLSAGIDDQFVADDQWRRTISPGRSLSRKIERQVFGPNDTTVV